MLYDEDDSVQELSGTTPIANRITGDIDEFFGRADSTGSYTPLSDALGSTIGLINPSGTIVTQYTYDPFGNTTTSGTASSNSFEYTGRENEGNGLYYYRARYYNPQIGHFISEDPVGFHGGVNLYAYAFDSPINWKDSLGLRPVVDHYKNPDDAGIQAIYDILVKSICENLEYEGYIYQNPDKTYSYTVPVPGTPTSGPVGKGVPRGVPIRSVKALYHTHGGYDPNYDNENFSEDDMFKADVLQWTNYLGTPDQAIKKYPPRPPNVPVNQWRRFTPTTLIPPSNTRLRCECRK